MKLFIDDDPNRKSPDGWYVARDSATAILFVVTFINTITDISFDHDLGGGDTSVPVADYIEEAAYSGALTRRINITVHSANPVGAKRLQQAIDNANKWWDLHGEIVDSFSQGKLSD